MHKPVVIAAVALAALAVSSASASAARPRSSGVINTRATVYSPLYPPIGGRH
jgi:hypothetical protein